MQVIRIRQLPESAATSSGARIVPGCQTRWMGAGVAASREKSPNLSLHLPEFAEEPGNCTLFRGREGRGKQAVSDPPSRYHEGYAQPLHSGGHEARALQGT